MLGTALTLSDVRQLVAPFLYSSSQMVVASSDENVNGEANNARLGGRPLDRSVSADSLLRKTSSSTLASTPRIMARTTPAISSQHETASNNSGPSRASHTRLSKLRRLLDAPAGVCSEALWIEQILSAAARKAGSPSAKAEEKTRIDHHHVRHESKAQLVKRSWKLERFFGQWPSEHGGSPTASPPNGMAEAGPSAPLGALKEEVNAGAQGATSMPTTEDVLQSATSLTPSVALVMHDEAPLGKRGASLSRVTNIDPQKKQQFDKLNKLTGETSMVLTDAPSGSSPTP